MHFIGFFDTPELLGKCAFNLSLSGDLFVRGLGTLRIEQLGGAFIALGKLFRNFRFIELGPGWRLMAETISASLSEGQA